MHMMVMHNGAPIQSRAANTNLARRPGRHCRAARRDLQCVTSHCNEGTECYLIVTCMVITDVPEAFFPLPVAVIAKVSLPLYLAFAVYW